MKEKLKQKVTDKTREELLHANPETLTSQEKMVQYVLRTNKEATLVQAIEALEMIP